LFRCTILAITACLFLPKYFAAMANTFGHPEPPGWRDVWKLSLGGARGITKDWTQNQADSENSSRHSYSFAGSRCLWLPARSQHDLIGIDNFSAGFVLAKHLLLRVHLRLPVIHLRLPVIGLSSMLYVQVTKA